MASLIYDATYFAVGGNKLQRAVCVPGFQTCRLSLWILLVVKRKRLAWKVFRKVGAWKMPTARAQSFGTSLVASNHQVSCEFWRAKCLNGRNNYYLKTTAICCLFNNAKKACYPNFGGIVYFLLSTWRTGLRNPSFLFPPAVCSQVEEWVEDTTAGLQVYSSMSWVSTKDWGFRLITVRNRCNTVSHSEPTTWIMISFDSFR